GICLSEVLEQFRLLFGGQADAGIRDGKLHPVAAVRHLAHAQGDLALLRELAGIAQEIEQNLLEPQGVRGERAHVFLGLDDEAVLVLLGELSRGADDLIDKPGQIDRLGIEFELAGFDLRKVEYLVYETQEVGPRGIHTAQRFQRLFGAEARRVGDHHLGQADDGVERGAQLVAHAGEELRLVLARQLQLAVLVLDFIEQAHILDGNHRLVGEGCEQLDLLVSEWRDLRLPQTYCAERHALAQQGYCQHCPGTRQLLGFREIIFPVCPAVWNLHYTALEQRATCRSSPPCADWGALPQLQGTGRGIVGSGGTAAFAIVAENHAVLGTANADGILQQRPKDALEVERCPADGLEHLGRGSLLPQRFAQLLRARLHLVEQPHILDRDHRLVGEGLDQLDLLVGKRPHGFAYYVEHTNRIPLAQERHTEHCAKAASLLRLSQGIFRIG